jgi:malonyl-CoA decarboxylase
LYVSLQPTVPSSMEQIHNQEKEFPPDDDDVGSVDSSSTTPPAAAAKVATFYSISNLQSGLAGVGLGEYLIKQAVKKLRHEIPSLDTFVTLSPIPNFRKWLQGRASASSESTKFAPDEDSSQHAWICPDDLQRLAESLRCEPNNALLRLLGALETERNEGRLNGLDGSQKSSYLSSSNATRLDMVLVERILTRLAAHYLVQAKHRRKPLDGVARFHVANGAEVYRINFGADMSRKGWSNSFGIMVNYKYNMEDVQVNQDQYESDYSVPVHENVRKLLG